MALRTKKTLRKTLFLLTAASAFVLSTTAGYGADERPDPVVLNAKVLNILQEEQKPVTPRVQRLAARIIEEKKTFFLSYCWDKKYCTKPMVDDFEMFLQKLGITSYYRDVREEEGLGMTPGVNIVEFMDKAKNADAVVIFLNDAYLRSVNCMYEFSNVWDAATKSLKQNVFVIKHPESPSIFGKKALASEQEYSDYWQGLADEVRARPGARDRNMRKRLQDEENLRREMGDSMSAIIHRLSHTILASYEDLRRSGFEAVFKIALPDERHLIWEELGDEQKQNARLRELEQEAEVAQRAEGAAKQKDKEYQEAEILRRVEEAEQRRIHEREEAELMERKRLLAFRESMIEECINTYRQLTDPDLKYGQVYKMMTKVFQGYDEVRREEHAPADDQDPYTRLYKIWGASQLIGEGVRPPTWGVGHRHYSSKLGIYEVSTTRAIIKEDLLATMGKYEELYKHTHPRREEIAKM